MANFVNIGNGQCVGLSTDVKPTTGIPSGYMATETDTGDRFIFDGTFWWLYGNPSPFSNRLIGAYPSGTSGTTGIGLLATLSTSTGASGDSFILSTGNGRYFNNKSGAVAGNKTGLYVALPLFYRTANPRMRMVFQMNTPVTNLNSYFGFVGGYTHEPTSADPFSGGIPGIAFGINTGNTTNFVVMHNDTTLSTVIDDTGIPIDTTAIHTVNMVADNPNARFAWNIDGGPYHFVTTDIIPTTNAFTPNMTMETEDAVVKSFNLYNWIVQSDT